jgi:hypothetical protein
MNEELINKLATKLSFFHKKIDEIAKEINFVERKTNSFFQRERDFIWFIVFYTFGIHNGVSLSELSFRLYDNFKIDITKQGIDFKLSEKKSANFLEKVFKALLDQKFHFQSKSSYKLIDKFNNVLLEDSTIVSLDDSFKKSFKGTRRASALKVNYLYNSTSSFLNMTVHQANENDQKLSSLNLSLFEKNDLIIRDLGYFKLKILRLILEKGIYFLSRYLYGTKIRLSVDGVAYRIEDLLAQEKHKDHEVIELTGYLGVNEKLKVRIVAYKMPSKIYDNRIISKEKGDTRKLSDGYKKALKYTILVTNIPQKIISADILGILYKFRWEIELVIKENKSLLKLGDISYIKNKNKLLTILYGRLISSLLIAPIKEYSFEKGKKTNRELSPIKLIKWLVYDNKIIGYFNTQDCFKKLFKDIDKIFKKLLKGKRKRETMRDKIAKERTFLESFQDSG